MGAAASVAAAILGRFGALRLSDEMPPGDKGQEATPEGAGGEGIDALPHGVLARVLGFLPAEEAVRTCVLARRWRHLWKSAAGLRVVAAKGRFLGTRERLLDFMGRLLLLRERATLDTCELELELGDHLSYLHFLACASAWFWHAVACRVQFLRLGIHCYFEACDGAVSHQLDDQTLVSRHLTRLELYGVGCGSRSLDFLSCPALEHLVLECCDLSAEMISCKSLKHLSITNSSFNQDSRIHICAPNLFYLRLENFSGKTPIIESMPSLVEAFVEITRSCDDQCQVFSPIIEVEDCGCDQCLSSNDIGHGNYTSVILNGVSEAKNLMLISVFEMYIFRMDLRCCPTFSKLKTLTLNKYWCLDDDFPALACILERSPVLEKLTLLFSKGPKHNVEMEGSISATERSAAISEHLKTVEIKCEKIDHWVLKVIWFLRIYNICFRK